jgi:2-haloacid dehalogenase
VSYRVRAVIPLLFVALTATACGLTGVPGSDAAEGAEVNPNDWGAVLGAAQEATLDLHMWGGSTEINRFVDEVYGPRLAELGITLNRVPLADTADAVNAVLGELEAGRTWHPRPRHAPARRPQRRLRRRGRRSLHPAAPAQARCARRPPGPRPGAEPPRTPGWSATTGLPAPPACASDPRPGRRNRPRHPWTLVGRGTADATAQARHRCPLAREVPMNRVPSRETTWCTTRRPDGQPVVRRRPLRSEEAGARMIVDPPPLALVLLEVNETLFPLRPVETRMAEVGLDGPFERWFTAILRDGFAAAAAGGFTGFRDLAGHHLRELLRRHEVVATDVVVSHVLAGFDELEPHPDVASGLTMLRSAGKPGGGADQWLGRAHPFVPRPSWAGRSGRRRPRRPQGRPVEVGTGSLPLRAGPARRRSCRRGDGRATPLGLFGAGSTGLVTAWVDRDGAEYPDAFGRPDLSAARFDDLIEQLVAGPRT